MKNILLSLAIGVLSVPAFSQNVAINTTGAVADSNAILDISSPNKGVLIPRMDSATRMRIPNTAGLLVYDISYNSFWYNTGSGWQNLAGGTAVNGWATTGNRGTGSSNFIGTIDNVPFTVKVGNLIAGRLMPDVNMASWGINAGSYNTTGNYNTAVGNSSLFFNTTGTGNTATGMWALESNGTGWYNTASGYLSLANHRNGNENVAEGAQALYLDTSGVYNTAIGSHALYGNTLGIQNTAVGTWALGNNGTGNYNTALGYNAGSNGYTLSNTTAIGYNAVANASNKVRIGNSAVTVIEGQVPFTTPSDGRFKYQIQEDVKGLSFIMQLRPVTYQFNVQQFDAQQQPQDKRMNATAIPASLQAAYTEAAAIRRSGFIAQEVEKAAEATGYNFSGLVKPKTAQEYYSLSYESFVVPLVKAVQEQQVLIEKLQQQVNELKHLVQQSKQ